MKAKQNLYLLAALAALFLVAACGQKYPPDSAEYVVQSLYEASARRGIPKDQATLSQYFDGRLTELLVKDFGCIRDNKPCGLLYFDPVAQSKTPDITDLELFKPEDENQVYVRFMQRDAEYKAICVMVRTAAGWRISDIIFYGADQIMEPGASLLTHLMLQTEFPPPWHPPVPEMPEASPEPSF